MGTTELSGEKGAVCKPWEQAPGIGTPGETLCPTLYLPPCLFHMSQKLMDNFSLLGLPEGPFPGLV